ncbi:hypothetical protein SRHO_G00290770 [Serrasalmus rhombeus]
MGTGMQVNLLKYLVLKGFWGRRSSAADTRATATASLVAQRGLDFALNWPPYDVTRYALTVALAPVRLLGIPRVVKSKMGL